LRNTTGGSRLNRSCGFSVGRAAIGDAAETSRDSSSPRHSRSAASWLTNPGDDARASLVGRPAPVSSRGFSCREPRTNRASPGRIQHSSNFRGESPAMPWRRRKWLILTTAGLWPRTTAYRTAWDPPED
jgi:hypothetical protein